VGYIIGTPNNKAFLERYLSNYILTIDEPVFPRPCFDVPAKWEGEELQNVLLQLLYAPEDELGHVDCPELFNEYPGHLHIDLLPEFQGRGFGKRLTDVLLEKMRNNGEGKGVHLIMAGDNINAQGFYMHLGFERYKAVLDDGKSGELGRHSNGNLWLTKRF
jgi:GNAT superfamily N-acetyltransferase